MGDVLIKTASGTDQGKNKASVSDPGHYKRSHTVIRILCKGLSAGGYRPV